MTTFLSTDKKAIIVFNKPFQNFQIKDLVIKRKLLNNSEVPVTPTEIGYNQSRVMIWFTVGADDVLRVDEKYLVST